MSADLAPHVLAMCEQAGLDCTLEDGRVDTVICVALEGLQFDRIRVNVGWEMSVVRIPENGELTLMSPWEEAFSDVVDIVRALDHGHSRNETGISLLWGPWHRTIVTGAKAVYGFTKTFPRHPRHSGVSYVEPGP